MLTNVQRFLIAVSSFCGFSTACLLAHILSMFQLSEPCKIFIFSTCIIITTILGALQGHKIGKVLTYGELHVDKFH